MKEIKGYEGLYSIDEEGNVLSIRSGKFLKPFLSYSKTSGLKYKDVALSKNGNTKNYRVHRLVALNLIENQDNLKYVDHIDRNQENNHVSNLRWCTASQNQQNKGLKNVNKTSKYKGVSWDKKNKKWVVYSSIGGKTLNLGRYKTENEAAKSFNEFTSNMYGEHASLNIL